MQAELLGMYPPGESNERIPSGAAGQDAKITSPPFHIRDEAKLLADLGDYALPQGFVPIASTTVENTNINGLRNESCPVYNFSDYIKFVSANFYEHTELLNSLKAPLQAALGLSDDIMAEADLTRMFLLADVLTCKY